MSISLSKEILADKLPVFVYKNRNDMGFAAGEAAAAAIKKYLASQEQVNMIFAAAPSQNETLAQLCTHTEIEWNRVNAFHMDEYVGLPSDHEQSFGKYLFDHVFSKLPFRTVNYINGTASDREKECVRYSLLLQNNPIDVVCLGIGENGHIAFNDPHVADFHDPVRVKVVELDEKCRNQQVHDGCFESLDLVPKFAFTLTIPSLTSAKTLICSVPAETKADAVFATVNGEISPKCPATVMRLHSDAVMYCDNDSGKKLL